MNSKKINYLSNFKKMWIIMGKNRKMFLIAILLTFLKTLFSVAASIMVGLLLQDAFAKLLEPNKFVTNNVDNFVKTTFYNLLIGCSIVFSMYVFYALVYLFVNKIILKVSYSLGEDIRTLLFFKINKLPYRILESKLSGELLSRTTLDANTTALNFAIAMGNIFTLPALIVCTYIALFIISPYLVLISFIFLFAGIFSSFIFSKYSAPKFKEKQEKLGEINSIIEENLENRKLIKMFNLYEDKKNEFERLSYEEYKTNKKAEILIGLVWPSNELFQFILSSFLYLIGIIFIWFNIPSGSVIFPEFQVGTLTSFCLLILFLMGETANSLKLVGVAQKVFISFDRVDEVLNYEELSVSGTKKIIAKGDISFKNVSFSYTKNKKILNNISFDIKANQKIAIVGPTGSGKTTIINLLLKFYDIDSGSIKIDGVDIKEIETNNLMENISVVMQDSFLFSESIFNNIKHGNKNANYDDVINAAKLANIHKFISKLENGYKTVVSEDLDFSQGQLQLISIARAILSNSKILIMDEATSYVDTKTEKDLQKAIINASKSKTVIMIAHRLSTVVNADNIIVIRDGIIEEIGNHKTLIKNKGFYYNLYKLNYSNN